MPTVDASLFNDGGPPPLVGRVFAERYRVEELIGEGAMGWVFLATHTTMGNKVALKVLRSWARGELALVKRFYAEARNASQLRSPYIVRVFDFGATDDGHIYLVMEYLEGRPLDTVLHDEGVLAPARVAHLGRQVALALTDAHGLGIVHRDLKPENLILSHVGGERDLVKVLDFGISRALEPTTPPGERRKRLTERGATLGTPHYMSPEQAGAEEVDSRSDLYALGVLLYEMLTGEVPFTGSTPSSVMAKHLARAPAALPARLNGHELPMALRELVMQLLEKEPHHRPQTARVVAKRLKPIAITWTDPASSLLTLDGGSNAAAPATGPMLVQQSPTVLAGPGRIGTRRTPRARSRSWFEVALLLLLFISVAGAAAFLTTIANDDETPTKRLTARVESGATKTVGTRGAAPIVQSAGAPRVDTDVLTREAGLLPARDAATVADRFDTVKPKLRVCAERHLKLAVREEATGVIHFTLLPNGAVERVSFSDDKLLSAAFEACAAEEIERLSFPANAGPAQTVRFPFSFQSR